MSEKESVHSGHEHKPHTNCRRNMMNPEELSTTGFEVQTSHAKLLLQTFPSWAHYDEEKEIIFIHADDGNKFSIRRGSICPEKFFIEADGPLHVRILGTTVISVRGSQ